MRKVLRWVIRMWREPFVGMTVDHIIPKSRGGVDCLGNSQILPIKVNVNKSDYLYEDMVDREGRPKNLAGKIYLDHTGGMVCLPCSYQCDKCPFTKELGDMAIYYSVWVPEDKNKPL